jgi:hypothetical protein
VSKSSSHQTLATAHLHVSLGLTPQLQDEPAHSWKPKQVNPDENKTLKRSFGLPTYPIQRRLLCWVAFQQLDCSMPPSAQAPAAAVLPPPFLQPQHFPGSFLQAHWRFLQAVAAAPASAALTV